jgi:hypothetical protein
MRLFSVNKYLFLQKKQNSAFLSIINQKSMNKRVIVNFSKSKSKLLGAGIVALFIFAWCLMNCSGDSRAGIGTSSSNTKNEWHYKFHYLQGSVQGHFTAKDDNAQLIYSSEIEKGTLRFELYNAADSLLAAFPANNTTDTINGFVKGEKYRVKAIVEKAKGRFDMEMK